MKIAYFDGTLRIDDGVSRVILRMAEYAVRYNHEAVIVTGYVEPNFQSPVPIKTIPSVKFPLYKDYRLPWPGQKGFKEYLDDFKPDIIHVHSPDTCSRAALKYAAKRNIPILATHHTAFNRYLPYYHLTWAAPILWNLISRLYNRMDVVTSPSEVMAEELRLHGIKNVRVFTWGVNLGLFKPDAYSIEWRKKICDGKDCPIVSSISRLTWEKDLRILAETYNLLKSKLDSGFKMLVAGEGPAAAELKAIMPGAIFKGHLEPAEHSATYASSDIFLFPSSTETFGLVGLEAMASGAVPVVADSGGSLAVVTDKQNGLLAQAMNPEDFCKKGVYLIEHPDERARMRQNGIEHAKQFGWDSVLSNIFNLYTELISNGKKSELATRNQQLKNLPVPQ